MCAQHLTSSELDALADSHVRYEVAMVVAQAGEWCRRYPHGMPPLDGLRDPVADDALLEAALVHLRLLDDFLDSRGQHPCDVRASYWIPRSSWRPKKWLPAGVRRRINWQVAHLSLCRDEWFDWKIGLYAYRFCVEFEAFLRAVEVHRPDRLAAFDVARRCACEGVRLLAP
jgi:hypothetical protein